MYFVIIFLLNITINLGGIIKESKTRKREKMKKILLGLGTIAAVSIPVVAVVSCSDDKASNQRGVSVTPTDAVALAVATGQTGGTVVGKVNVDVQAMKLKAYYTFKTQVAGDSSSIKNVVFTTTFDMRGGTTYSMTINGVNASQVISDAVGALIISDVSIKAEYDKQMNKQMGNMAHGTHHNPSGAQAMADSAQITVTGGIATGFVMIVEASATHLTTAQANKALDLIKAEYNKMTTKHDLAVFSTGVGNSEANSKVFIGAKDLVNTFIKANTAASAAAKIAAANALVALAGTPNPTHI